MRLHTYSVYSEFRKKSGICYECECCEPSRTTMWIARLIKCTFIRLLLYYFWALRMINGHFNQHTMSCTKIAHFFSFETHSPALRMHSSKNIRAMHSCTDFQLFRLVFFFSIETLFFYSLQGICCFDIISIWIRLPMYGTSMKLTECIYLSHLQSNYHWKTRQGI